MRAPNAPVLIVTHKATPRRHRPRDGPLCRTGRSGRHARRHPHRRGLSLGLVAGRRYLLRTPYAGLSGPNPSTRVSNPAFLAGRPLGRDRGRERGITHPIVWAADRHGRPDRGRLVSVSHLCQPLVRTCRHLANLELCAAFVVLTAMHRHRRHEAWARIAMLAGIVALVVVLTIWLLASGDGADAAARAPTRLNGSGQYAPALLALLVFSVPTLAPQTPAAPWIWAATGTFCCRWPFAPLIMAVCAAFPWHPFPLARA